MAKIKNPKRAEALEIFKQHGGKISNKTISDRIGVPEKTLSSWKSRDNWENAVLDSPDCSAEKKLFASDLNDKEKLFCLEYVESFNATKAYQKAYRCEYRTARTNGNRIKSDPRIVKHIENLKREKFKNVLLDADSLLQKRIDIAFSDITDFVEFGTTVKKVGGKEVIKNFVRLKNSSEVDGSLITEIKEGRDGVAIKLVDKEKSLEFLTNHYSTLTAEKQVAIEAMRLENDIRRAKLKELIGDGSDNDDAIKNFLEATKPDTEELTRLFEDEEI